MKAVIFDLDGVIVDTIQFYYHSTKRVADELNVPFTEEDNLYFQGRSRLSLMEELVKRSGKHYSHEELVTLGEKRNAYYLEWLEKLDETYLLPGIKEFLQEVKEANLKTGLASSSSNAKFVLDKLNLDSYFDVIVDPKTLIKGKPDPEIFLTAADRLNVPYESCVAIEDGEAGLEGILATPMFSVGIGQAEYLQRARWWIKSSEQLTLASLQKKWIEVNGEN
ncbi:beta-phosphoglucomutase [Bacillus carboniphilus]|uniref:Beta-phosphoglucomutase n=1 Tax=Bacillus carboniphilus TaxID=86663 RepID=A0ABY9JVV9_9BACI|nr:beta-phosphoglucomutase [Bacillus carboniphilus]WLR41780.1 beta-phosphoglucomutase [Bacillus carboniphilus]